MEPRLLTKNIEYEQITLEKLIHLSESISKEVKDLKERKSRIVLDFVLLLTVSLLVSSATAILLRTYHDPWVKIALAALFLPIVIASFRLVMSWRGTCRHIRWRIKSGNDNLGRLLEMVDYQSRSVLGSLSPIAAETLKIRMSRIQFAP